jgi:BNR repeat-containing family member
MKSRVFRFLPVFLLAQPGLCLLVGAQADSGGVKLLPVAQGWASNSINTVAFRKNSLVTWGNTQFIAFYNHEGLVVLGKRKTTEETWTLQPTRYAGNTKDAHNSISIMVDGDGFLHVAWDHHNTPLKYARSRAPGALELTEIQPMTGIQENRVTYPEFYSLPSGNLLFFYRDGESGKGNLIMNHYEVRQKRWVTLQPNMIDGEGQRNAYWQACVDAKGTIHLSWVWRESADVASNHDLCYARSVDGGKTWERSNGKKYQLPITASSAEYAYRIPEKQELINQTSMAADAEGNPFIASYWREGTSDVPQYHLIFKDNETWQRLTFNFRTVPFSLSGMGTKRIPLARPQVLVRGKGKDASVLMIFRDAERGNKASAVISQNIENRKWEVIDLLPDYWGAWEPTYDTELWRSTGVLNLFMQRVEQADAEGLTATTPQPISILQWNPLKK